LEIDPGNVDVIVSRWQQVSGKIAVLEASGASFDQTRAERAGSFPEVH
jgi:hypothetical protein